MIVAEIIREWIGGAIGYEWVTATSKSVILRQRD